MIFKGFSMNQIIRSFKEVESPILREHATEITDFKKKQNKVINKQRPKIILKFENLLYFYINFEDKHIQEKIV